MIEGCDTLREVMFFERGCGDQRLYALDEQTTRRNSSKVKALFTNKIDARGTVFVASVLPEAFTPVMERLVDQLEQWHEQGQPVEKLLWQSAPPQLVKFTLPTGRFFPRGLLAEIEIDLTTERTQLFLSSDRISKRNTLSPQVQVDQWTQQCYGAIYHEYRVLRPLREQLARLRIVQVY